MNNCEDEDKKVYSLLEGALTIPFRKKNGVNILFGDKGKNPQVKGWNKWCGVEQQTDEDIKALFDKRKNDFTNYGFAVGHGGLIALDFDWEWVYWRANDKKLRIIGDTFTARTPNGGYRVLVICHSYDSNNSEYKSALRFDIFGGTHYAACYGTALREDETVSEYKSIGEEEIKNVDSLNELEAFLEDTLKLYDFLTYPCIASFFATHKKWVHLTHEQRLAICNLMLQKGISIDEAQRLFMMCKDDYNEDKTRYQCGDTQEKIKKGGLKPPTCETLKEAFGYDGSKCQKCSRKQTTEGKKRVEKKIPQIALRYKDKDFGMIELEKVDDGVLVSIKKGATYLTYKSHQRLDFWTLDVQMNKLFKHINGELGDKYQDFLSSIKPQIEDKLKQKKEEVDTDSYTEEEFDEYTKTAALELLRDPKLIFELKQFLDKWGRYYEGNEWKEKKPVVGEDGNKLHVVCACISALYTKKINELLIGASSVGKSRVASIPLLLFKSRTEDLSGMTEASPKYIEEDLGGKILVLKEIEGSEAAEYYLKILFDSESEDMNLRTTEKDPGTNRYTSIVRHVRGKPVGITTTATQRYGTEYRNRFSLLQMDESKEQTKRIKKMEMRMANETPIDLTDELKKFRCAFSLLQPIEVKIPFNVFYPSDDVEARRAYKRLLTLVEVITFLHQYQRETFIGSDGVTYLKATILDLYYAHAIAKASIGMDLEGITKNSLNLYNALLKRHEERQEEEFSVNDISSIAKVDLNLNWRRDTVRGYLKELREADYLSFYEDESKRGKPYIYSIRSVDAKDVAFRQFIAEKSDQQKKLSVEAVASGEEAEQLLVFDREKKAGVHVYNPFDGKLLRITSTDKDCLEYIYTHTFPPSTNTNNTDAKGESSKDKKDVSFCRDLKTYKKQQINIQKEEVSAYDVPRLEAVKEDENEKDQKNNIESIVLTSISKAADQSEKGIGIASASVKIASISKFTRDEVQEEIERLIKDESLTVHYIGENRYIKPKANLIKLIKKLETPEQQPPLISPKAFDDDFQTQQALEAKERLEAEGRGIYLDSSNEEQS